MSLFTFFKRKSVTKTVAIPKPLELGCIAQSIIQDFQKNGADIWEIRTESYGYAFKNLQKKYSIVVGSRDDEEKTYYYMAIQGVDGFNFSPDERKAISVEIKKLLVWDGDKRKREAQKRSDKALRKIFPDCFK